MARGNLILIFQSGGKFAKKKDGSLSYTGGEAHAVDVNNDTRFDDLKLEIRDICNCDIKTMSIKYFIPGNKRTLITISNDKDLQRMIDFYGTSGTADVYLEPRENLEQDSSKMPTKRASGPIVADSINQVATPTVASTALAAAASTNQLVSATIVPTPCASANAVNDTDNTTPTLPDTPTAIPTEATPTNGAVADKIGKRKRTASWKVGNKGLKIVSVADDVVQKGNTESVKNDVNSPTTVVVGDDVGQKKSSTSSETDNKSLITFDIADDVGRQGLIASWKVSITGVGQNFNNVHEFRDALRKFAIAHRFVYKLKKNETDRCSARCRADGCSWRIHASWVPAAKSFRIKKFNDSHTCGDDRTSIHPQTTKRWLASILKDKLQDSPHYKPKEILNDLCRDFGIELNYSQAWRGIETAREQLQGPYKDAYDQLPWFCDKLVETNPGSVARFTTKEDLSFQRLFVSFHASLHGFENCCRSLLFLDATSLKSKYQEILLAAIALDGDDGAFPIAFAVVEVDDDDNWHWFLEELKALLSTSQSITFVLDKEKAGLKKSVHELFENAQHGYSIYYLMESFRKNLKGPYHGDGKGSLVRNFLAAAHALRLDGFRKCTESIKRVSSEAYNWVMKSEPEYWATTQFKGERYNYITSDIMESFDDWIAEVRELPITQKIGAIICKIMELINTRRVDSSNWPTNLTPSKAEKLQEESLKAHTLKVLFSSDSVFEVHHDSINVVNIDQWDCSCREWKITGLPCCHAIAVFNCTGRSPFDYCSRYFMSETYQLLYSVPINPLPEIGKPVQKESSDKVQVYPPRPQAQKPQSRPKRKLNKLHKEFKKTLHCSKCKGAGHNKVSCKATA